MEKFRIPSIIAVFLLVAGVAAGVFLVQQSQTFKLSASGDFAPRDIRITNISSEGFTVSWYTDKNAVSSLSWGKSQSLGSTSTSKTTLERIHYITVSGLAPNTTYYFEINSGGERFNNSGVPWSIKTAQVVPDPQELYLASGKIYNKHGQPAREVIVYAQIGGARLISTQTSKSGSWILPLSSAMNHLLSGFADIDQETLVDIFVQGGPLGIATVQIYAGDAHPTPDIALGKSYSFRDLSFPQEHNLPDAEINLPVESPPESRFEIGE